MKKRRVWAAVALMTGALGCAATAHAAECRFDRTLSVDRGGSLHAGTGSGYLKVVAGDGAHVHISGHAKSSQSWFGSTDEDVQRLCNNPPIEQTGNMVKVGGQQDQDWFHHVTVDYVIEVPRSFTVTAGTGSGTVELDDLGGAVVGTSGSGTVRATNLSAGARLEAGSGSIVAVGLSGDTRLGTGSGSIQARFMNSGDVRATTGSGSIHLDNVSGGLVAHAGSGNVEASGKPRGEWQIGTGSGSVRLHLPANAGFTLDAQASSGGIESSLPLTMQGGINRHHVHGVVAGGGPEVRVSTGSGSIRID